MKKVQIKEGDKTYNIQYNEKFDVQSNTVVYDGINYSYVVKIKKK